MQHEQSRSLFFLILLHACVVFAHGKKDAVKLTPKLDQQGYKENIQLREVIAEAMVDSREACEMLCEETSVCSSVMLTGQLCMLFQLSHPNCKVLEMLSLLPFNITSLGSSGIHNQKFQFRNFRIMFNLNALAYNGWPMKGDEKYRWGKI